MPAQHLIRAVDLLQIVVRAVWSDGRSEDVTSFAQYDSLNDSVAAISPATDVYAMGIMLYQLTSGEPPFSGTLTQIFSGHLHGTVPPLRARAKARTDDALARWRQSIR